MSSSLSQTASSSLQRRSMAAVSGRKSVGAGTKKGLLELWWERRALRCKLAELDDHLLRDIGVTREDAIAEARKPFWIA